jgi:hypothetical protein
VEEIMKQLGSGIVVAFGLTFPAFANPPQLKGDYAFTYNETCSLVPSGNVTGGVTTGIEHFNGDGTGTVKSIGGESLNLGSPPQPFSTNVISFQFTYVFNPDGTFTMTTVPGTFVGSLTSAGGLTFGINGNQWLGQVSNDAKSHSLVTVTPFLQVVTVNTSPPTVIQRMCYSTVTAFALNPAEKLTR